MLNDFSQFESHVRPPVNNWCSVTRTLPVMAEADHVTMTSKRNGNSTRELGEKKTSDGEGGPSVVRRRRRRKGVVHRKDTHRIPRDCLHVKQQPSGYLTVNISLSTDKAHFPTPERIPGTSAYRRIFYPCRKGSLTMRQHRLHHTGTTGGHGFTFHPATEAALDTSPLALTKKTIDLSQDRTCNQGRKRKARYRG